MGNFKVRVNNEAESREAQELFFELGYGWHSHGKKVSYLDAVTNGEFSYLVAWSTGCFTDVIQCGCGSEDAKELTLPELRLMVKPMKEYLNKKPDGSYELIVSNGGCVDGDWIKVPSGMNYAYREGSFIQFTKQEMGYRDSVLAWQRTTHPEESPFIDDGITDCREAIQEIYKPSDFGALSLNDQYAEIEQVRQAIKAPDGNDSDHALDAMSFGLMGVGRDNVRQTLNERESQYGSFKDVADTTALFMDQFALGRMSNVQREALHMICSKLARIANGDPNHVDSWHDISGYATLVVDDLES